MKKYSFAVCFFFTLLISFRSTAQTDTLKQQHKLMIRHSVIFKFKSSVDSIAAQNFFIAAKKLSTIPGVQNFESLRQISKKNKFEFGLSMEFSNEDLYQQYNNHPMHVQFIKDYWLNYVEDFMEIDYETLK